MDGAVLTLVITKLSDLLEQKVRLIAGAEDEIRSQRDELNLLTIFLDGINDQSDRATPLVQELIHQLQRVSCDAEDVADQYLLDVAQHERKKFPRFTGCGKLSRKGKLAAQAKDIKLTIDSILRNKDKYGVRLDYGAPSDRPAQQTGENALDRRRRNVEEEDVVGFDKQTCEVMEMLMPEGGGVEDEGLRVVSIIGMGGLGKSTLARKIFNHEEIKSHFEIKVWVVVSEYVEAKHVLENILQSLKVNIEKDDDKYLKDSLKTQLVERRYLIVLDDLWTPKQYEELKSYLPTDEKRGSRILLTSRIENVANVASTASTTHHLNPLGDADSWSLFCKKALKGEKCPSNLEAIGKGIVSKCKGLPLAIIVLGSLLSAAEAEPSFKYWSKILGDTSWHPDLDNDCSKILSLSYRNLPPHLKACFLYVGIFPEDFEILAKELCSLWVAEGFVNGQNRQFEEDDAEQNLINLADRNLIIITKIKSDGSIKSVRIHDLLRDMCMKEVKRCNLYEVNVDGVSQNFPKAIRRLKLAKNMILLRYLKIDQFRYSTGILMIKTRDIRNLSNLQVLNLVNYGVTHLPIGIWKLKVLRHIHVRTLATMPDAQSSHDSLPYLRTLSCILFSDHILKLLRSDRFPNLRKLFLVHARSEDPVEVESLQSLPKLLHLVAMKIGYKYVFFKDSGPLKADAFPSTLTKIHLESIALTSDHWKLLGELNNLQVLKLSTRKVHASSIEESFLNRPLVFEAEAFPQLIHLKLRTRHQAVIMQDGALRSLQCFIIHPWIELDSGLLELPDQLWLSATLKQVKVVEPSDALRNFIQSLDEAKRSK
uniref:Uncharacterized protein n=1 Tax=Kalanchoe fedtschenkoi TaxID=63787 RepID=A0A7N0UKZ0_KALFE